jgi:iron complex outermembrane receptor protein
MKKVWFLFSAVLFAFVVAIGAAPSVSAQDDDSNEFQLEEITVTAQKRAESQQKVAIAMEVLSAEDLRVAGKNSLDDILSDVGSVMIQKAADGIRVSLRGVSDDSRTFHNASVSTPTVAVNMDGVYSNRKDMSSGLFDLERVEVLFGPQSTMYSSNSPGGIVNVETARPKLDKFEASGTLEVGNYDLLHTQGMVNLPLAETVALRMAFTTSEHDGYVSNGGDSEDTSNGRLRLLYQPTENLSFILTGEVSRTADAFGNGVDPFEKESDVDDPWESDAAISPPTVADSYRLYGRMDWDMDFASLSVLPSYTVREADGIRIMESPFGVDTLDVFQESEEKSVEVRLSSSEDFFFKWIVGVNYYEQWEVSNDDNWNGVNYTHLEQTEELLAGYANVTYPITDSLRATAGLRLSSDTLKMVNEEVRGPSDRPDYAYEVFEEKYDDPDYKIGFEFDLSEDSMLYADYSTSYRVQSMAGGGVDSERPPEELKAYSAGVKNRFMDNRLQVNVAAYYYDYQNYACGDMVTGWWPGDQSLVEAYERGEYQPMSDETEPDPNASGYGHGEMMGFDIQSTFVITPKDVLSLTVNYLKSEWTDLTFDYEYDYGPIGMGFGPPGGPVFPIDVEPLETVSYNGLPMTAAPEWTVNGNYSHRFSLPNGGELEAKVNAQYKTEYNLSWRLTKDYPLCYQEAFATYGANLTYTSPGGSWSLSAYGRNLTNYAEKRMYFGEPVYQMSVGNPRTYGAVITARF